MSCQDCKNYKETYPSKGYCKLWDVYVKFDDECESEETNNE